MSKSILKMISELAESEGLDGWGVSTPPYDVEGFLESWVRKGRHGKLKYMENNISTRSNPSFFFNDLQSVISFALSYSVGENSKFASYALGTDYHYSLGEKLHKIAQTLEQSFGGKFFVAVDIFPIAERAAAAKSKMGWIGKSGNFILPSVGPNVFLGEILTSHKLDTTENKSEFMNCGDCTLCIDSCPTGAICDDQTIDVRKCLSYYTTEIREVPPENIRDKYDGIFWGCEKCVLVCPYLHKNIIQNKKTPLSDDDFENFPSLTKGNFKKTVLERMSKRKLSINYIISETTSSDNTTSFTNNLNTLKKLYMDDPELMEIITWAEKKHGQ
ncbi:MAG: DUF1730 domain-containing protein [Deltaproteobacteria bacterium]|nr:DUF1730 domain-containing protein [Deltaproteobacteria bacterium]